LSARFQALDHHCPLFQRKATRVQHSWG
jgi:hypothetical protein